MAVLVGSADADRTLPASAVRTSVVPAAPVLPAAASALAVCLSACGGLRDAVCVLGLPEMNPPSVPAGILEAVPVLHAAKVLPLVVSAPVVTVSVVCTTAASVAPSHVSSEHQRMPVPAPTVLEVLFTSSLHFL